MNNTAVFAFGRFNPPHVGHELLIQKVGDVAFNHNANGYIFASHTTDSEKNPLKWKEKVYFLSKMFPYANISTEPDIKNLFDAIAYLGNTGYNKVILVAGSDRVGKFKKQIKLSQLKDYGIDGFSVSNAGFRTENAKGTQGASSTKQRQLALNGDFDEFSQYIPNLSEKEKKLMYNLIRKRTLD